MSIYVVDFSTTHIHELISAHNFMEHDAMKQPQNEDTTGGRK
jgi:hypothetical protein